MPDEAYKGPGSHVNDVSYTYRWPIRSGDTDFSGLVYTPAVIDCLVEAAQALLEDVGFDHQTALSAGLTYPAVHAEADYVDGIGIGDTVTVELTPDVGTTSVTFEAVGTVEAEVFQGELTLVFVDADSMDPQHVPARVADELSAYA